MSEKSFLPKQPASLKSGHKKESPVKKKRETKLTDAEMRERYVAERKKLRSLATPIERLVNHINVGPFDFEYNKKFGYYDGERGRDGQWQDQGAGHSASTSYADDIVLNLSDLQPSVEVRNFLEDLKGTVVVDLGSQNGLGYWIAAECKAKAYIGVEKFDIPQIRIDAGSREDLQMGKYNRREYSKEELIPFALVREDMLDFLKRLPDNSVSILAAGISVDIGREFQSDVEREIARVLDPHGAYINYASFFAPRDLIKSKCTEMKHHGGLVKFTKPAEKK